MYKIYYLEKDFTYCIDQSLDICFKNKETGEEFKFPTLLGSEKDIKIPPGYTEIRKFLRKEIDCIPQERVKEYIELFDLDFVCFAVSLLDKAKPDFLIFDDIILVYPKEEEKCIFFTDRMLPPRTMEKLYLGTKHNNYNSAYMQACEEIIPYIGSKIATNIEKNTMIKEYADRINPLQLAFSREAGAKKPNLINLLSIYNKILQVRSEYVNNEEIVFTEEEINEIKNVLSLIKEYMNCSTRVKIKQV